MRRARSKCEDAAHKSAEAWLDLVDEGRYVVIQYDTTFENKKSAVETITPMMDSDGRSRVAGYYIK